MMVVVTDITEALRAEEAERRSRELLEILRHGNRDRAGLLAFLRDADRMVEAIVAEEEPAVLARDLHTLKGNTSVFGLRGFAAEVHRWEDTIGEQGELDASSRQEFLRRWTEERERIAALGFAEEGALRIDREAIESVLLLLDDGAPARRVVARWLQESTRSHLERLAQQAHRLGERLGKPVSVEVDDDELTLPPGRFDDVWSAIVHVVRNAVDHGIEDGEARRADGKDPVGTLRFSTRLADGLLTIAIEDDGAGIDWDRVAARAASQGMPTARHADLVAALFADGLTTRDEISAVSGRGVGTAAVASAVRAHGGWIDVWSAPGRGSCFTFTLPIETAAPPSMRAA